MRQLYKALLVIERCFRSLKRTQLKMTRCGTGCRGDRSPVKICAGVAHREGGGANPGSAMGSRQAVPRRSPGQLLRDGFSRLC
jgi:hypothetical protein